MKKKEKTKEYIKKIVTLCLTFLKIGALTFGGGYAMISIIDREAVTKRKWLSEEEMIDVVAISESTPGPISLNAATYIGAKVGGFLGAFLASISVMLPSILVIILISLFLVPYFDNPYFQYAFLGMRAGVAALILNAVLNLGKFMKKERNPAVWAVFFVALVLAILSAFNILSFDNVYIIIGAIVIGLIYSLFKKIKEKKGINSNNTNNSNKDEGGDNEHLS